MIGGTRNLGPDIAAALVEAGFAVTVFHRGVTQSAALAPFGSNGNPMTIPLAAQVAVLILPASMQFGVGR